MKIKLFIKKACGWVREKFDKIVLSKIFLLYRIDNLIMFESIPDLGDSTKPVFDEMIKRGLNKKYKMVWLVNGDEKTFPQIDNVSYIKSRPTSLSQRVKLLKLKATAKCLVCCNDFLVTQRRGQFSIYITHGSPLKSCVGYYSLPKNVDRCVVQAKSWITPVSKAMVVGEDRIVALGYPRNDAFSKPDTNLKGMFECDYNKIVAWYPTYRQHKSGKQTGAANALPIVHDEQSALELNDYAKEKRVLIVIKPHFAQDVSKIRALYLSNIVLISDDFFIKNNITSYEFIKSCDSLITDYSSVYYDYLLADKPVAVVWEDYEEYSKNPGFAVDTSYYLKAAEKIYDLKDFKLYIDRLSNNIDMYKQERSEINRLVNYSDDGKNAQRVAEYIVREAKL